MGFPGHMEKVIFLCYYFFRGPQGDNLEEFCFKFPEFNYLTHIYTYILYNIG